MSIEIVEESVAILPDYGSISIAFLVASRLRAEPIKGGLGGVRLIEEQVEKPYLVDFDKRSGEGPARWLDRWNIGHWGVLSAFDGSNRIGGAVVAWRTPGLHMLEGRDDLAVLWDIRVQPEHRGQGVGSRLFGRAVNWAQERGYGLFKVETQNTNVAACRFYAKQGCELGGIRRWAYVDAPDEVQLLWYLELSWEQYLSNSN